MHSAANAPETASDPRLRFPNWTANDTQIGQQMIPLKKLEWRGQ